MSRVTKESDPRTSRSKRVLGTTLISLGVLSGIGMINSLANAHSDKATIARSIGEAKDNLGRIDFDKTNDPFNATTSDNRVFPGLPSVEDQNNQNNKWAAEANLADAQRAQEDLGDDEGLARLCALGGIIMTCAGAGIRNPSLVDRAIDAAYNLTRRTE